MHMGAFNIKNINKKCRKINLINKVLFLLIKHWLKVCTFITYSYPEIVLI